MNINATKDKKNFTSALYVKNNLLTSGATKFHINVAIAKKN